LCADVHGQQDVCQRELLGNAEATRLIVWQLNYAVNHVVLVVEIILSIRLLFVKLHACQNVTLDRNVCKLEILITRQIVVQNAVRIDVNIEENLQTSLCE
jgi:hypothetical protein